MKRLAIVVYATLMMMAGTAAAQTTPDPPARRRPEAVRLTELALRDGSRMYGAVVSESDTELLFRTQSGTTMTVTRSEVLSVRPVDGVLIDGEFQPSDPNVTRMFFGPTGRSLKRGQVYVGVYEILFPFVQVGITDRLSIGAGTPLVFFTGDNDAHRLFWLTPKMQVFRGEKTQVSLGAFHELSGHDYAGIGYAVATHGTAASSFTVGMGSIYASEGSGSPVVMFGAERQTRRNMKAMTENYIWSGGRGVASAGVRFFGEKMSTDLAAVVPFGNDGFLVGALVNFVYIF